MATGHKNLLLDRPQKKVKVKARHERVATEFEKWLADHPKASHREIYNTFDLYCDTALLDEKFNGKPNTKSK